MQKLKIRPEADCSQEIDIVAFGAHPDDIELGCGGSLISFVKKGYTVAMVDLTEGEMGTRGSVPERRKEAQAAADIIGARVRHNLAIADAGITNTPVHRRQIIEIIRCYRPQIILAPYPNDRHPDHVNASHLISDAAFYAGVARVDADIEGAYRPQRVVYYMMTYEFEPSFMVDISKVFEQKMKAIQAHESQFYNPAYSGKETFIASKEYLQAIRYRAGHFGWKAGCQYAEPFWVREPIALDDPLPILIRNKM